MASYGFYLHHLLTIAASLNLNNASDRIYNGTSGSTLYTQDLMLETLQCLSLYHVQMCVA